MSFYNAPENPEQKYMPNIVAKTPPNRVVSLVPGMTETLFDLGFGSKVVGITDDCLFPEGKLDSKFRVGRMDAVRVDDVVGLRPDLVITNEEENTTADIVQLEAAGLTVWRTFPRTVLDAMNLIWDVLYTFHVDDRLQYERVNLINRTIDWVGSASEAKDDAGIVRRVFAPLLPDPFVTVGPDTYAHDLLKTAGGTSVFAHKMPQGSASNPAEDATRYPIVTTDEVEAAQPELVLLPAYPLAFTDEHVEWFSKLDIPAAKSKQIYLIDGSFLTYHGTRLARALNQISELMYPPEDI
ncbi:MAG: helical backbone metal receptor [Chloroflexota bacterium]